MKKFFLKFLILFFYSINSYGQVVYIDINQILNNSEIGKSLNLYLKEINDKNLAKFNEIETKLKKKEKELLAQQNIIEKTQFNIKVNSLSKEVQNYRTDKKTSLNKLNEIKIENTKKILEILNPIITKYVELNSISLVIPKKNIIVGRKNLDITDQIIKLLNDNIKKINF